MWNVRSVKSQCQEKTGETQMFSDVDGRQTKAEDAWMSDGNEFRTSDAATGNVRRATVVSRIQKHQKS